MAHLSVKKARANLSAKSEDCEACEQRLEGLQGQQRAAIDQADQNHAKYLDLIRGKNRGDPDASSAAAALLEGRRREALEVEVLADQIMVAKEEVAEAEALIERADVELERSLYDACCVKRQEIAVELEEAMDPVVKLLEENQRLADDMQRLARKSGLSPFDFHGRHVVAAWIRFRLKGLKHGLGHSKYTEWKPLAESYGVITTPPYWDRIDAATAAAQKKKAELLHA